MTMLLEAIDYIGRNPHVFLLALSTHLKLSIAAVALGAIIAVPAGLLLSGRPALAALAINLSGTLRALPSLAILALMLPLLGTGFAPSLVALIVYAVPPILINTYVGVRQIDPEIIDAANGMGLTRLQVVRKVQVPLALPVIFAGLRTAAVQVVAGATLAAFIGGGGLGDFITAGIAIMDFSRLLVGAVPVALLAIATELGFSIFERLLAGGHRPGKATA